MYLIWIFGSKLIRSNNQSRATPWVLETCLIVGLLPFMIILITASSSSNTYNKASWCGNWTFEGTWSILFKTLNIPWDRFFGLWLLSQFTTGCSVLWWFVSSSKLKFVLSREKRVWGALPWGQTTGLTVLSWFTSSKIRLWFAREKRGWDGCSEQTMGSARSIVIFSFFTKRTCFFRFPENGAHLFEGKQRVSPFYHDLGLDLVGLIGNSLLVEQLLFPVVE